MKENETELRILDRMTGCRHFRGVQHDLCEAGINIRELVGGDDLGWACRMPCLGGKLAKLGQGMVPCEKYSTHSREEAEAIVRGADEAVVKFLSALAEGRCPICNQSVTQRQVGHCVYGSCGHRLYQGKVNPDFATKAGANHATAGQTDSEKTKKQLGEASR